MSLQLNVQFFNGLVVDSESRRVHSDHRHPFACLTVGESGGPSAATERGDPVTLFFYRVEDIETLVAALQDLGNEFAAKAPAEDAPERRLSEEAYEKELAGVDKRLADLGGES